jgi:Protein of unknown function (DUF1326)
MAQTQQVPPQAGAVYSLQGTLIEACSCNVLCPCWIGEDPDGGECFAIVAWHIDSGQVTCIDVSGRSVVGITHIPGNILAGNWSSSCCSTTTPAPSSATPWSRSSAASSAARWPTWPS